MYNYMTRTLYIDVNISLQCAEAVRNVLQYCDISKDLQEFIDNNKLSGKRPGLYTELILKSNFTCEIWNSLVLQLDSILKLSDC